MFIAVIICRPLGHIVCDNNTHPFYPARVASEPNKASPIPYLTLPLAQVDIILLAPRMERLTSCICSCIFSHTCRHQRHHSQLVGAARHVIVIVVAVVGVVAGAVDVRTTLHRPTLVLVRAPARQASMYLSTEWNCTPERHT